MSASASTPGARGVELPQSRLSDLAQARSCEWLVTNGRGGFAMGTPPGLLTRRYHGLLAAAVNPPADRRMLLAKLESTVVTPDGRFELATNDYPGTQHPTGWRLLERFSASPMPTWRWRLPGAIIEQTLFMPHGADATFVQWRLIDGPAEVGIEVRPLCTNRSVHHLTERFEVGEPQALTHPTGVTLRWAGDRPPLRLSTNGEFVSLPDWYYQFVLAAESDRGQSDRQDLFTPGVVRAVLRAGDRTGLVIAAAVEDVSWQSWAQHRDEYLARRTDAPLPPGVDDPLAVALARATDAFIVHRGSGRASVIAGYPWFADWGRDTFISLPGLCLVTGRFDVAREIIGAFAQHLRNGIVPNRFPDVGEEPDYNTVDASLWFVHAVDRYLAYSADRSFVADRAYPAVASILSEYARGTAFGIRCDDDGLLAAGRPDVQLTWMDAKIGDWVVTPRTGKPVEINALWFNALRVGAALAERFGDTADRTRWSDLAARAAVAFNQRFWNAETGCCFDVVDCNHVHGASDAAIRPNQLFAISLPNAVLERERWPSVMRIVHERLFTPIGLRTLDPAHPQYRPHYRGPLRERDAAYHQGTVWPWLFGPYATAYVKTHGQTDAARREARAMLAGLEAHLAVAGLDSVAEVAEAEPPHRPDGCPFQAWSVAEPLRALLEDIQGRNPSPTT